MQSNQRWTLPILPLSVREKKKKCRRSLSGKTSVCNAIRTYLVCGEDYTFNLHVRHSFSQDMFQLVWKFVESGVGALEPVDEDNEHEFLGGFSQYKSPRLRIWWRRWRWWTHRTVSMEADNEVSYSSFGRAWTFSGGLLRWSRGSDSTRTGIKTGWMHQFPISFEARIEPWSYGHLTDCPHWIHRKLEVSRWRVWKKDASYFHVKLYL